MVGPIGGFASGAGIDTFIRAASFASVNILIEMSSLNLVRLLCYDNENSGQNKNNIRIGILLWLWHNMGMNLFNHYQVLKLKYFRGFI
jgi:hypothetical protein